MLYSSYFSSWGLTSFTLLLSTPKQAKKEEQETIESLRQELARKNLKIEELTKTLNNIEALQTKIPLEPSVKFITAKILLKRDSSDHRNSFVINKGKLDGVPLGAPVTYDKHLLGITYKLSSRSSMVLQVSDPFMHIPVFLMSRKGKDYSVYDEGMCVGQSKQKCKIKFIQWQEQTSLPNEGVVLTAGFGRRFPTGLIIGNTMISESTENRGEYMLDVIPMSLDKIYNVAIIVNQGSQK